MPKYAIDLFCGAGGCSEGLIQAGFNILFSSDISAMVEKTYVHRHEQLGLIQGYNTWFERSDIKDLTGTVIRNRIQALQIFNGGPIPEIDLMIGGPSCQGFSRAGRRDTKDPRNKLFGEYVRVIHEVQPKYIVLENVEGFMDMQFYGYKGLELPNQKTPVYPDGTVTPVILRAELERIGYHTLKPRILNAADYGVPQRRNRVIFIGYRDGLQEPTYPEPLLKPEEHITLKAAIGDLIKDDNIRRVVNGFGFPYQQESHEGRTPDVNGHPIEAGANQTCDELSRITPIVQERFSLFEPGETGTSLRKRIHISGIDIANKPHLIEHCKLELGKSEKEVIKLYKSGKASDEEIDVLLTKKNVRQRWNPDMPSATVVSIPDDYISPWEDRTFSVREMARLQSFDDSFEFLGKRTTGGLKRREEVPQYTQVGNAVPPLLARAVAAEIMRI